MSPTARLLVLVAIASLGCSQPAATQLIVVVDTDYAVPSELDELVVDVTDANGVHHTEHQAMPTDAELPYTLAVVPQGSALGPLRIEASGRLASRIVVTRDARVTLVAGQTRMVRLDLLRACAPIACPTDQTCVDGSCTSIDVTPVAWPGMATRLTHDAGAMHDGGMGDGGVDAASVDGSVPDDTGSGSDAGHDAATPSDAGHDAAIDAFDCHVSGCDDGNPCTNDVCGMGGACSHANNTASCGTSSCGAWSTCDYTGDCHPMQSRTCMDHVCAAGACTGMATHLETQPCPLAPSGTDCTDPTIHCGTYHCNATGSCLQFSGGCIGSQVCCNPPVCSIPTAC